MTACVGPERHQWVARALSTPTGQALTGGGRRAIAVDPLRHTARERMCLGLGPGQPTIEFGDGGALVKEDLPILRRPAIISWVQQPQDVGLVQRQEIEHRLRGLCRRLKFQVVAIDTHADANGMCRLSARAALIPAPSSQAYRLPLRPHRPLRPRG